MNDTQTSQSVSYTTYPVETHEGYSYYIGWDRQGRIFYNIVTEGSPDPSGGYYDKEYLVKLKQLPDMFGEY